ncbi:hypothetical protein ACFZAT_31095 [Streptomyces sp. NPDC008163]
MPIRPDSALSDSIRAANMVVDACDGILSTPESTTELGLTAVG